MKIKLLWNKNDKIALALSGGVDSVVLFHLLINKYKNTYKELVIFHINHGLREEALIEEEFITEIANKYQIKLYIERLFLKNKEKKAHISEEMLARELRYNAFRKMADKENISILITAHHKNDNVENILMRILSGRGLTSSLEIEEKAKINNLNVVRPMINILKREIIDYAEKNNIKYYEDVTNNNIEDYTRNYIRHKLIPNIEKIEGSYNNIVKFADNYKKIKTLANEKIYENIEKIAIKISEDKIEFSLNDFLNLKNLEKQYFLSSIIKKHFKEVAVKRKSLEAAITNINEFSSNITIDLKKDFKIIKEYQSISICKTKKKCYNDIIEIVTKNLVEDFCFNFKGHKILINKENISAELGLNQEDFPIFVTSKKDGDRIKRGKIYKKLSRIFIDEKIPKSERSKIPIIKRSDGEILGLLGIGSKVTTKNYDYYIKILKG